MAQRESAKAKGSKGPILAMKLLLLLSVLSIPSHSAGDEGLGCIEDGPALTRTQGRAVERRRELLGKDDNGGMITL